mmetsp:Transcript_444/g.841  ORF Transcript_444/g.841 Transcript_444/m.841 type:complete len:345 (-) Transcript_444:119-1153(-)
MASLPALFSITIFLIAIIHLSAQECSEDGICIAQDDVRIPKYANRDGRPAEAIDDCFDKHEQCPAFVKQGECEKNPGWMIINCPLGCNACHLRDASARCSRDVLNTTHTAALYPGRLNEIFERIARNENNEFGEVTVLSRDPWVVTFDDFMNVDETNALVNVVEYWERSTDTGRMNKFGEVGRVLSDSRTSSNSWCREKCESNPHVRSIIDRIAYTTSVPVPNYESFQVLRYEIGQYYKPHHDTGGSQMRLACGPRILTFFLYLSDVEEGGETAFPKLDISVSPKRGKALMWPGVMSDNPNVIDHRTIHEARPVTRGLKYAANTWIHQYDFKTANLWGCTGSFD